MRLWTEGPDVGGDRGSRGAQVAAPLIVSALVGLATLTACGRHRSETNALPRAEWLLRVENRHWSDVRVSVMHDGLTTPVGTVTATQTMAFVLAPNLLGQSGEVRLMGDPIGGGTRVTTEPVRVASGQQVLWTLERALSRSSVAVW